MRYWFWKGQLSDDLCDLIIKEANAKERLDRAGVVGKDQTMRVSEVAWFEREHWIHGIARHYIWSANANLFDYDLTSTQRIQYTVYNKGGFYAWHSDEVVDKDKEVCRKLSATILLSDPDEYEGGEFQLIDAVGKTRTVEAMSRGSVVVFESRTLHQVTKVKKGTRRALVAWAYGPRFR